MDLYPNRHFIQCCSVTIVLFISQALFNPLQAELVGTIAADFQISEGAASYSVSVPVPPGVAGMQPQLSFNYRSGNSASTMGEGWSLGGLSAIHRCRANLAEDGYIGAVIFAKQDRFCLNGRKLKAIAGQYGEPGTQYRTDIDSFSKIVSYGALGTGPSNFKVWTKSGRILEYGSSADTRVMGSGKAEPLSWLVSVSSDRSNNSIYYHYNIFAEHGDYSISEINYAGNSIKFSYTDKSSTAKLSWLANVALKKTQRLNKVSTYAQGTEVNRWLFNYQYNSATEVELLSSMQQCAANQCLPATTFSWLTYGAAGINPASRWLVDFGSNTGNWQEDRHPKQMADVNGDARPDIVAFGDHSVQVSLSKDSYFAHSSPWINSFSYQQGWRRGTHLRKLADVNGDGLADVVGFYDDGVHVAISTGSSFSSEKIWINAFTHQQGWDGSNTQRTLVDVNNDGRADILGFGADGVFVSLSQGNRFSAPQRYSIDFGHNQGWRSDQHMRSLADVNGDGYIDVVAINASQVYVALGSGSHFAAKTPWSTQFTRTNGGWLEDKHPRQLLDINGDGQADLVGFSNSGLQVALSTGTRFAASQLWSSDYGYSAGWRIKTHQRMIVDVNGDGITDLLGINQNGIHVSYGDGQSFSSATIISSDFSNLSRDWDQRSLADVNGDGLIDVIGFHAEGVDVATMRQDNLATRGRSMIATITNGYQRQMKIRYSQMTDASIYTKGTAAIYPARDMIRASFLVAESRKGNGIGSDSITGYRYGAAVTQLTGRGFQGFKWIEQTDQDSGIITTRHYRQQFPFTGMLDTETKHYSNNLISKLSHSYLQHSLHNNRSRFPYLSQAVAQKFQLSGPIVSTTTTKYLEYDLYGNLLRRSREVTGGSGRFNQQDHYSLYPVDQQQWLLGLVSKHRQINSSLTEAVITTNHHYTYDHRGYMQSQTLQQGKPLSLRTQYTRDSFGNITSVKVTGNARDSNGNSVNQSRTSSSQYDTYGRFVMGTSNALGQQQSSVYEPHYGNLISHSDVNGLMTTWQYDLLGRKIKEQRANGKSTLYSDKSAVACEHAPAHTARCHTSAPEGETPVTVYYDNLDREVRTRNVGFDGRNVFIDTTYNVAGLLAKTSRAYYQGDRRYWAEFSYDVIDRIITERQPSSNATVAITRRQYSGLVTKVIDAKQQTTVTTTDALGQIVHLQDPLGASIVYRYDAAGNLLQTIDDNGNRIQLTYDQLGNKVSMQDPDKGFWQYSYNAFGELVSQTDAKGQTSQLHYDALGRMVKRQEPGLKADSTEVNSWQYDSADNGIGLLAEVNGPNNYRKSISYDVLSRPITAQTQVRDGSVDRLLTVRNQYDEFSRLYRQYRPSAEGEFVLEHLYNPQGFLQSVRSHKGLVGDYSASHLTQLINQATQQAADIFLQADIIQAQVQSYFNKADYYRSLSLIVTPISANSSQVLVENDQRYPIYIDSNSNQYLRKPQIIASGAKNTHWVLAVGAHTLFIPKVKKKYSYALLKQQGDGSWQLSDGNVVSTQLTKGDSYAYVGDFNLDSQQDLIMVSGEHPSGQYLAAAASSLIKINRDIEIVEHLQRLEDAAKVLVSQGIDIDREKYQLFYNTRDRKRYIRLPHPSRSGGIRMLLGTRTITPVTMPVIQFLELTVVNGQYRLTRATDTFAHPDFDNKFIATGESVYIGDNNQDGNTDLAVARPLEYRAFEDSEPLGLAFFIELKKKADVIEAVAVFLQKQATDYQQLADNILVLAETSYRQANNLQLWVDNYQQFDLDADYVIFWQAKKRDAEGRLSHSVAGSGLTSTRNYDPATGQLLNIQSGFFYSQKIRDLEYQYDLLNNLTHRADLIQDVQEQFTYDALDRLNYATVSSNLMASLQYNRRFRYQYDSLGNLTDKTGAGTMGYGTGSAGPHAVTRVNNKPITYDQNGNMIRNNGRTFAWNSANQPVTIKDNLNQVSFNYAPDRSRYLKTSASSRTFYLDKIYERVTSASTGEVSHKNMIYADGKLVATNVETITPGNNQLKSTTRYMHYDPLGSIDTITGPKGEVVDRLSFDPFGARRPGDWRATSVVILPSFSNRGFTGHEHIDELGLIHMNGRIYDPQLGRFISADKKIQAPDNSQSFNRYAYVWNNPLKYTDPSGWDTEYENYMAAGSETDNSWRNHRELYGKERDNSKSDAGFVNPVTYIATLTNGVTYIIEANTENLTPQSIADMIKNADPVLSGLELLTGRSGDLQNAKKLALQQGGTVKLKGISKYTTQSLYLRNLVKNQRRLATVGKVVSRAGTRISQINLGLSFRDYYVGEISGARFSYKAIGVAATTVVASVYGGVPGAGVALASIAGETLYDIGDEWVEKINDNLDKNFSTEEQMYNGFMYGIPILDQDF